MSRPASSQIDRHRNLSLAAILSAAFAIGIAFGGLAPLLSLTLEARGVDTWLIGLNSAMGSIGIVCATFFTPRMINRLGPPKAFFIGSTLVFVCMGLLAVFDSLPSWFAIRFVMGLGLAMPWVVSETWMNAICKNENRARVMALYTTVLAGGFAAGPVILTFVGTSGSLPFICCAVIFGVSVLPIYLIRKTAPPFDLPSKSRLTSLAKLAPTIFLAALISGVLDTVIFSLLPIYGLRLGFDETTAVLLLSSFLMGNLVLQYPIGWLADQYSPRLALMGCAVVCIVGPLCSLLYYSNVSGLAAIFFIWGGAAWSIYAIGLAMMGGRFKGGELAVANATFVMVFEVANISAPPLAGLALDAWEPHGLMVFLCSAAALFLCVVVYRGINNKA